MTIKTAMALAAVVGGVLGSASAASAQVFWNESVDGDLSDNRLNPTAVTLALGDNRLLGVVGPGDLDYLRITLPAGLFLSGIILEAYESVDQAAFIAVQEGTIFTETNLNPEVSNLLGYALFGPAWVPVGEDLLPEMAVAPGAIGFTPPLTAANYTFWIQQTGDPTTYTMNFVVIPTPGTIGLLAGAGLLAMRRRR